MIMKLGIGQYEIKLYSVYINDDPELTMTYFTCLCTHSRPRYQVSVYRTIDPLVSIQEDICLNLLTLLQ